MDAVFAMVSIERGGSEHDNERKHKGNDIGTTVAQPLCDGVEGGESPLWHQAGVGARAAQMWGSRKNGGTRHRCT